MWKTIPPHFARFIATLEADRGFHCTRETPHTIHLRHRRLHLIVTFRRSKSELFLVVKMNAHCDDRWGGGHRASELRPHSPEMRAFEGVKRLLGKVSPRGQAARKGANFPCPYCSARMRVPAYREHLQEAHPAEYLRDRAAWRVIPS